MKQKWLLVLVGIAAAVVLTGCRSEECSRMMACCRAIEGKEGVGQACGQRARAVDDPNTCLTILESVEYMWENREDELPEACRVGE